MSDFALIKDLKDADLRYIDSNVPGIFRKAKGSGFNYFDLDGKITNKITLERIKELKIPPAWKNVWICPSSSGYLQATGMDAKARKQYIYHPKWRQICQENKFNKLTDFAKVLPKIREKVKYDLGGSNLDKARILAAVVWLLEHTFIRVGNEEYVKTNDSFGLTTLRNRHVRVWGDQIKFEFKGKSGVYHSVSIDHPSVARVIKKCLELPGFEIFQYVDNQGFRHVVDSEHVNLYLKATTGENISAKEFRTWGGTTLCAQNLNTFGHCKSEEILNKNIKETVTAVAKHLRNTTKVCQNYYIHPVILETYKKNIFIPEYRKSLKSKNKPSGLSKEEFAVLNLIENYS